MKRTHAVRTRCDARCTRCAYLPQWKSSKKLRKQHLALFGHKLTMVVRMCYGQCGEGRLTGRSVSGVAEDRSPTATTTPLKLECYAPGTLCP